MGIFSKKARLSTEDFCENFYNDYVFAPSLGETNPWYVYCEVLHRQLVQADSAFSAVNIPSFTEELLALRLEIIGIVWMLHVTEDLSPIQSECTRRYLSRNDRSDIWEKMEPYNQATGESTKAGFDYSTGTGRFRITFINQMRVGVFDKYVASGSDPIDAARAANRFGIKGGPWTSKKTHLCLSSALTRQLHCEPNEEARAVIIEIIQGFYDGFYDALYVVKIVS